jgi:hypothetical protein
VFPSGDRLHRAGLRAEVHLIDVWGNLALLEASLTPSDGSLKRPELFSIVPLEDKAPFAQALRYPGQGSEKAGWRERDVSRSKRLPRLGSNPAGHRPFHPGRTLAEPTELTDRVIAWRRSEIEAWLRERARRSLLCQPTPL